MRGNNNDEPSSYLEAINSEEAADWIAAMHEEINSLKNHNAWKLVELPAGVIPVKNRWVFKRKTVGEKQIFKARLVAKGFSQVEGMDYNEIYAPVSNFETIRLLIAVSVEKKWEIDQYDVKSAYLHSQLKENVYMLQPEGFIRNGQESLVCKLNKSIYGLKQSGRCWNDHLNKSLENLGFIRNDIDPCVYQITTKEGKAILSVYVDDILVFAENEEIRQKVKTLLESCFEIKHMGMVSHMLGVKFEKSEDGTISLSQEEYINHLLDRFGLQNAKGAKTTMEAKPNFLDEECDKDIKNIPYRELIGGLLYLSQRTRPDLAFSVAKLSQYCSNFNISHWNAAKRVLRYVKETANYRLSYYPTGQILEAFADADWATSIEDRKSITGYLIILAGSPVYWKSMKQTAVALSTMEAEYVSVAACAREVVWMRELLKSLDLKEMIGDSTPVWCDNQAAITHSKNHIDKSRTKHISIKHHFIREKVMDGTIDIQYISTEKNVADLLTKPLCQDVHQRHCKKIFT